MLHCISVHRQSAVTDLNVGGQASTLHWISVHRQSAVTDLNVTDLNVGGQASTLHCISVHRQSAVTDLIVGAHIQADGQALGRVDAAQGGVERQLAHGDAHAVHSKVAQTQDPLSVRHHDRLHGTHHQVHFSGFVGPQSTHTHTHCHAEHYEWLPY